MAAQKTYCDNVITYINVYKYINEMCDVTPTLNISTIIPQCFGVS